jgi:hypothetical protein
LRPAGLRGERRRVRRRSHPKFWPGFDRGQLAVAWTGPTGPLKRWPSTPTECKAPPSVRPRCGRPASGTACAPIGRPLRTCRRPLPSGRSPARACGPSKRSRGGGTGLAQSSCSALLDAPHLADAPGPQRASPERGHPGRPCSGVRLGGGSHPAGSSGSAPRRNPRRAGRDRAPGKRALPGTCELSRGPLRRANLLVSCA